MAYKSRVTNQYMGASFAGQVASSNKSDVTDLVNILQKEINPALGKIYGTYIDTQKEEAKNKINSLLTTKDSKTVQQEILEGKHPELEGAFTEKTVAYHLGRQQAVDTMAEIEKNKSSYDFRQTNLPAFYKQYLPDFKDKDGSYTLGFAAVFNQYKAKDAIQDAEKRNKYAGEQKVLGIAKTISVAENAAEAWGAVDSYTKSKLPNGTYASNEEGIQGMLRQVENIYSSATSPEEIDKALSFLTYNRGIGTDGTQRGSLADTKRKDVYDLVQKLNTKRVTLANQERLNADYKEKQETKDIFIDAITGKVKDENGVERPRTHAENLELRAKLAKINPSVLDSFDRMMDNNRYVNTDPQVFNNIVSDIFDGKYESQADVFKSLVANNVPKTEWAKALTYYSTYNTDKNNGTKPVYATDYNYTSGITSIVGVIKGNFNVGIVGQEKPNSYEAIRNATYYMRKEIMDYETNYKAENGGRSPSTIEKNKFLKDLGDIVRDRFTPENLNPTMKSVTQYEEELKNKQLKESQKQDRYQKTGVGQVLQTLNKQLEVDKGIAKMPQPDLSMFGADTSWFSLNETDKKRFINEQQIPYITNYLKTTLGDMQLTPEMIKIMEQVDYNQLLKNISNTFTMKIEDVDKAIKALVKTGDK
jgi:hypothetical protein